MNSRGLRIGGSAAEAKPTDHWSQTSNPGRGSIANYAAQHVRYATSDTFSHLIPNFSAAYPASFK
jgi:hypothetical protein